MNLLTPWRRNGHSLLQNGSSVVALQEATDLATTRRRTADLAAPGSPGIVHYGGVLVQGDYDRAWQGDERDRTIRRMADDPVIGAAVLGTEILIRGVPWYVDPANDSPEAADIAEFYRQCLKDMRGFWPGDTMARILTYLVWGWSVLSIGYKQRNGMRGDPRSRFDDGMVGWDEWMLIPQFSREGWEFDERKHPTVLIQRDPGTFEKYDIPLDRCLHFKFGNRDNSPEGYTPLRMAFDAWYRKAKIQVVEGIGIERDLAGLPKMRIPAADIQAKNAVYKMAMDMVTGIRVDAQAGVILSSGVDKATGKYLQEFELLSTGGGRQIDTDPIVRRYANELITVYLANVLRTGQDGTGSYALADVQGGLYYQGGTAHLDLIQDTINDQETRRLAELNGFDQDLVPTIRHGDIENADLQKLGAWITALAQAGLLEPTPELRNFVHQVAGLPAPSIEDMEKAIAEREEQQRAAQVSEERIAQEVERRVQEELTRRGAGEETPPGEELEEGEEEVVQASDDARARLRQFVDARGELSLTDLLAVKEWFDSVVPDKFRGLLEATTVKKES